MFPIKGLVDKDGMDELSIDDFFVNSIFIYPKQNGLIQWFITLGSLYLKA